MKCSRGAAAMGRMAVLVGSLLMGAGCGAPEEMPGGAEAEGPGASQTQALDGYNPLPSGITWQMHSRFPTDTDGDGVRNERNETAYVRPSGYWVKLDACVPGDRPPQPGDIMSSLFTYTWNIDGVPVTAPCRFDHFFPTQRPYDVRVRIEYRWLYDYKVADYQQTVRVKDFLIVSMGDSYGAGEGAPDIRAHWDQNIQPKWANERCHRSFNSPSARAALALEEADPHTSVTYISLACSGATISRETFAGGPTEGFANATNGGVFEGSGVLGPYKARGSDFLRPQVDDLNVLVGDRQIDALVMSLGGNDVGFADILTYCTYHVNCHEGDDGVGLRSRLDPLKNTLASRYDALAAALGSRGIHPRSTYLMEYPEIARNEQGGICDHILQDTHWLGRDTSYGELKFLDSYVYQPLLNTMQQAAARNEWTYVGGNGDDFAGRGVSPIGHGYCAAPSNRWINTANDSDAIQGPKDKETETRGTCHPNVAGYQAMADRLVTRMFTDLSGVRGHVDDVTSFNGVRGWAYDRDASGEGIWMHYYVDGPAGSGAPGFALGTGVYRPDVNQYFGITGWHGFALPIPEQYYDGQPHTVWTYGLDLQGVYNPLIDEIPRTFQFNGAEGHVDRITSDGYVEGWALDFNSKSTSIAVHVYLGGPAGSGAPGYAVPTDQYRDDVNAAWGASGNHGFRFRIPDPFRDGTARYAYVYGIDAQGRHNPLLDGRGHTFLLGTPPPPPPDDDGGGWTVCDKKPWMCDL